MAIGGGLRISTREKKSNTTYLVALEDLEEHPEELVLQKLGDGLQTEQEEHRVVYDARPCGSRTV